MPNVGVFLWSRQFSETGYETTPPRSNHYDVMATDNWSRGDNWLPGAICSLPSNYFNRRRFKRVRRIGFSHSYKFKFGVLISFSDFRLQTCVTWPRWLPEIDLYFLLACKRRNCVIIAEQFRLWSWTLYGCKALRNISFKMKVGENYCRFLSAPLKAWKPSKSCFKLISNHVPFNMNIHRFTKSN